MERMRYSSIKSTAYMHCKIQQAKLFDIMHYLTNITQLIQDNGK